MTGFFLSSLTVGLGANAVVEGGISISIGSGPVTTGTTLTASVSGVQNGQLVEWGFQDDGADIAASEGSGTWPQTIDYSVAIGAIAEGSAVRAWMAVDGGDRVFSAARTLRPLLPVAGAGPEVSVTVGEEFTPVDLIANWTLNGNTMSWRVEPDLPDEELSVDPATAQLSGAIGAVLAQTTYTLIGTDAYGVETSGTFTLAAVAAPVVNNPVVSDTTYTDGVDGNPATAALLALIGDYQGSLPLILSLGSGTAIGQADRNNLIDQSGGTGMLEYLQVSAFTFNSGNFSLPFTDNAARELFGVVHEDGGTGASSVFQIPVTNLAPATTSGGSFATASDLFETGTITSTEVSDTMNIGTPSAGREVLFLVGMEGNTGRAAGFDFTVNGTSHEGGSNELASNFQSNATAIGFNVPVAAGTTATVGLTQGTSGSSTANTIIAIPHTGSVVDSLTDYVAVGTALTGSIATSAGGTLHILLFGRDDNFDNGTITITDPSGATLETTIVSANDIQSGEHPINVNSGRAYVKLENTSAGTTTINLATTATAPSRWNMIAVALDN
ncbi:MAG: hypothetical protein AAGF32_03040 [Pseudomonadota bacterium]